MKLANVDGRAALVLDDAIADVAERLRRPLRPRPRCASTTTGPTFVDVRRRASPTAPAPSSRPSSAARSRPRARCSPSGSTTAATPRSPAWPSPRSPPRSPSSPPASAGRSTTSRSSAPTVDWEVELVAVIGTHRRPGRRGRRVEPRRRAHHRPGHQRPAPAVRRRRAVLARQVAPGLRADGPVARHASTR